MKTTIKDSYVKIKLFKSRDDKYNKPQIVCLNGVTYSVPRGVETEVPRGVAEILQNAEIQNGIANDLIETLVSESK